MALQSVRGTHDLLPEVQAKFNLIIRTAGLVAERFGYREMSTPIFEFSDVFKRTLGDESDIVNKEMYTFTDRGGDEITLRPEGTAAIVRAFISEGLSQQTPFKVFYQGPMFRYERPQKGRQRQFHQIGVELLGSSSPYADVECLSLANEILKALQVRDLSTLEINSIGDHESRSAYVTALVKYLQQHQSSLSPDSQRRLERNPLRILDSKDEKDQQILRNAPIISEFYNETSRSFFATVTEALKDYEIPFNVDPFLVRGLDYYMHCVFEFRSNSLGAQNAILSGGRYDHLVKQMGGPDTPSFGWAAGIERLAMLSPLVPSSSRAVAVIPVHNSVEGQAFQLANRLRSQGVHSEIGFSGNLSKRMKRAAAQNCWGALIIGPDEIAKGEVTLKLLDSGEQKIMRLENIAEEVVKLI